MDDWDLEWFEYDPAECWVKILSIWLMGEIQSSLQSGKGGGKTETDGVAESVFGSSEVWSTY